MIVFVALLCAQPDFQSLRVRQLKEILQERGQKCDGCLEKQEYVDRCLQSICRQRLCVSCGGLGRPQSERTVYVTVYLPYTSIKVLS